MSLRIRSRSFWLVLSIAVSQIACGFHLRGEIAISERALPVHIENTTGQQQLERELESHLKRNNIESTDDATKASTKIKILSNIDNSRVISVDTLGRASEYRLESAVTFKITSNGEDKKSTIRVSRDLPFDSNNILSFKREEKILREEMRSDIARLIMLQLEAFTKPKIDASKT